MVFDWLFNRRCRECKCFDYDNSGHKICRLTFEYNEEANRKFKEDKEGVD
jgi:hypothetical protein